ncbi:MAG TPA: hypothetical protein ENH82_19035 [bacterium]|nr:hypothetical protein [bacterium]
MDNSKRNEDICRERILLGMTVKEVAEKHELATRSIFKISKLPECKRHINKYKKMRDEVAKESVEAVKKLAGQDAEEYYQRLREIALQKTTITCPECENQFEIKASDATSLRALLAAMGVAGLKMKQDEEMVRDLPKLTIHARKKPELIAETKAG